MKSSLYLTEQTGSVMLGSNVILMHAGLVSYRERSLQNCPPQGPT